MINCDRGIEAPFPGHDLPVTFLGGVKDDPVFLPETREFFDGLSPKTQKLWLRWKKESRSAGRGSYKNVNVQLGRRIVYQDDNDVLFCMVDNHKVYLIKQHGYWTVDEPIPHPGGQIFKQSGKPAKKSGSGQKKATGNRGRQKFSDQQREAKAVF
jgi:hypothetical protein